MPHISANHGTFDDRLGRVPYFIDYFKDKPQRICCSQVMTGDSIYLRSRSEIFSQSIDSSIRSMKSRCKPRTSYPFCLSCTSRLYPHAHRRSVPLITTYSNVLNSLETSDQSILAHFLWNVFLLATDNGRDARLRKYPHGCRYGWHTSNGVWISWSEGESINLSGEQHMNERKQFLRIFKWYLITNPLSS